MQRTTTIAMIIAALVVGFCIGRIEIEPPVELVRVIDGDTIIVQWRGAEERVRLLRIDTPERGQPGYAEATDALRALLSAGPIRIEFEQPGRPQRDKYGRLLAYVFADGKNINAEMVHQGHSEYCTEYGKSRLAHDFK